MPLSASETADHRTYSGVHIGLAELLLIAQDRELGSPPHRFSTANLKQVFCSLYVGVERSEVLKSANFAPFVI
jgi:hypothetical protein